MPATIAPATSTTLGSDNNSSQAGQCGNQFIALNSSTGHQVELTTLVQAALHRNVLLVGECHDDTVAHRVEHLLFQQLLNHHRPANTHQASPPTNLPHPTPSHVCHNTHVPHCQASRPPAWLPTIQAGYAGHDDLWSYFGTSPSPIARSSDLRPRTTHSPHPAKEQLRHSMEVPTRTASAPPTPRAPAPSVTPASETLQYLATHTPNALTACAMSSSHGSPNLTSAASTAAAAAALTPVLQNAFTSFTGSLNQLCRTGFGTNTPGVSRSASAASDLSMMDTSSSSHGATIPRQAVPSIEEEGDDAFYSYLDPATLPTTLPRRKKWENPISRHAADAEDAYHSYLDPGTWSAAKRLENNNGLFIRLSKALDPHNSAETIHEDSYNDWNTLKCMESLQCGNGLSSQTLVHLPPCPCDEVCTCESDLHTAHGTNLMGMAPEWLALFSSPPVCALTACAQASTSNSPSYATATSNAMLATTLNPFVSAAINACCSSITAFGKWAGLDQLISPSDASDSRQEQCRDKQFVFPHFDMRDAVGGACLSDDSGTQVTSLLWRGLCKPVDHEFVPPLCAHGSVNSSLCTREIVLSLEMFEADVQPVMDEYLAGSIHSRDFMRDSRPWPNYKSDYHSLVLKAYENKVRVVAANPPRRYVSLLGRGGSLEDLPVLPSYLPPPPLQAASPLLVAKVNRELFRAQQAAPTDEGTTPLPTVTANSNFMSAQSLWDATMARSIATALQPPTPPPQTGLIGFIDSVTHKPDTEASPLVMHVCGKYHMEQGLGIPEHLAVIAPSATILTVVNIPTALSILEDGTPKGAPFSSDLLFQATGYTAEDLFSLAHFVILTDRDVPRSFAIS